MDIRPEPDAERAPERPSSETGGAVPAVRPVDASHAEDDSAPEAGLDASLLDAMERELVGDLSSETGAPPAAQHGGSYLETRDAFPAGPQDRPSLDPEAATERADEPSMSAAERASPSADDAVEPGAAQGAPDPDEVKTDPADDGGPTLDADAKPAISDDAAELTQAAHAGMPLEAVEFELALNAQDIVASGFEAAVRRAADMADGSFLFHMPAHAVEDCQRVAAVSLAGLDAPFTLLVLLGADGRSVRLEDAQASDNPLAGMAVSYGGLLAHLKSLPARAAA